MLLYFLTAVLLALGEASHGPDCPAHLARVKCYRSPCDDASCPNHPHAICSPNNCGGCFADFYEAGRKLSPDECRDCPEGVALVNCFRPPCDYASCPNHPCADCYNNYCGGCFADFYEAGRKLSPDECRVPCDDGFWTPYYDRDDPSGDGDYETMADLRRDYPELCQKPTAIEAVAINLDLDYISAGQVVTADVENGFRCDNKHNTGGCCDYKVRFCCPHVPYCKDNAWTDYYDEDDPSGECDCETLYDLRKKYPEQICRHPHAVHARLVSDRTSVTSAGQVVNIDTEYGFSCFNKYQKNWEDCHDYEVSFCCPQEPEPYCPPDAWTCWYNRDKPSEAGDSETLDKLRKENPEKICEHPTSIDVRVASTGDYYWKEGQNVIVSPHKGFQCNNAENSRPCLDYEVRFCCPEDIDDVPTPTCEDGRWTTFIDRDDSKDNGDFETLDLIRFENPENICENPSAIDVRFARNGASYLSNLQNVVLNLKEGFYCENKGQKCEDYKVRFCCPEVCEKKCPDGYWTRFFDIDDPDDYSDHEPFDVIRQEYPTEVCGNPTDIDVRLLNGDDYTTAGQDVEVSLADGFLCKSEAGRQECCDYKVRFCCQKFEPKCIKGEWTTFMSLDDPSDGNEYEPVQCDGLANSIDVRLMDDAPYTAANQVVHISPYGGFRCINNEQPDGELCQDYKARFCCNEESLHQTYHTCAVAGNTHYYTLDGKLYTFQGDCLYNVLSTIGPMYETCLPEFSVWAQNEYRASFIATYVGKVFIRFSGQDIILFKDGTAGVNGISMTATFSDNFFGYEIEILPMGTGVTFRSEFGLTVSYRYEHHLQVSVSESYFERVEGLCGNFNGDPNDDFTLQGTSNVVDDVNVFTQSFALSEPCNGPLDFPPCEDNLETEADAFCTERVDNVCSIDCPIGLTFSVDDIIDECTYHYCYVPDEVSVILQTAQTISIQCELEEIAGCADLNDVLDNSCGANRVFELSGCVTTCDDPTPDCENPGPGCQCMTDYVRNKDGNCIPVSSCACTGPDGNIINHGDELSNNGCDCICDEGSFDCTNVACGGTCTNGICETSAT